jgi:uncharacterized membrane protein YdfJ with MMPL/SSD domain
MIGLGVGIDYGLFIVTSTGTRSLRHASDGVRGTRHCHRGRGCAGSTVIIAPSPARRRHPDRDRARGAPAIVV